MRVQRPRPLLCGLSAGNASLRDANNFLSFYSSHTSTVFTHLGYPAHFVTILGIWKVLGAGAILIPGFALLKEWEYAGMDQARLEA